MKASLHCSDDSNGRTGIIGSQVCQWFTGTSSPQDLLDMASRGVGSPGKLCIGNLVKAIIECGRRRGILSPYIIRVALSKLVNNSRQKAMFDGFNPGIWHLWEIKCEYPEKFRSLECLMERKSRVQKERKGERGRATLEGGQKSTLLPPLASLLHLHIHQI